MDLVAGDILPVYEGCMPLVLASQPRPVPPEPARARPPPHSPQTPRLSAPGRDVGQVMYFIFTPIWNYVRLDSWAFGAGWRSAHVFAFHQVRSH